MKPWHFWSPSGWDLFGRSKSRQLKHYNLNQLASSKNKEKLSKTQAYCIINSSAGVVSFWFCLDAFSISKWASVLFQMSLSTSAQCYDVSWGVDAQGEKWQWLGPQEDDFFVAAVSNLQSLTFKKPQHLKSRGRQVFPGIPQAGGGCCDIHDMDIAHATMREPVCRPHLHHLWMIIPQLLPETSE